MNVGQTYNGTNWYQTLQAFLPFDTSAIPDDATIGTPELKLSRESDNSVTDFILQVYAYDFGATVTTADYRTRTQAAALTPLLATYDTAAGWGAGYRVFTSTGDFAAAINKTGETRLFVVSDRFIAGTSPAGKEYVAFAYQGVANRAPTLTVTYTEAATGCPKMSDHYARLRR